MTQPDLIPTDQPSTLDCGSNELIELIAKINANGGRIVALHVTGVATYRLSLMWEQERNVTVSGKASSSRTWEGTW